MGRKRVYHLFENNEELKWCNKCKEWKNINNFFQQKGSWDDLRSHCKNCCNKRSRIWEKNNRDKTRYYNKKTREKYRDKINLKLRDYYKNNRKKEIKRCTNFAKENRDQINKTRRLYYKNNRGKVNARNSKRRADKLRATPQWLTPKQKQEIQDIYIECSRMSKGDIKYEVDHIIPLKGKTVRGLHVPWNLQILTRTENARKNNKLT